jgi:membrane-associated protease RseP (regulator of RpoE activity)
VPVEAIPPETVSLPVPPFFSLLSHLIELPTTGAAVVFHPVAFASCVGMLVTMLNLMPVGMLDGGHVARAILGERWHQVVSLIAAAATFALGWWYMALFMLFFSFRPHIGPLDDVSPLTRSRKIVAMGLGVILFLCAVPGWKMSS